MFFPVGLADDECGWEEREMEAWLPHEGTTANNKTERFQAREGRREGKKEGRKEGGKCEGIEGEEGVIVVMEEVGVIIVISVKI